MGALPGAPGFQHRPKATSHSEIPASQDEELGDVLHCCTVQSLITQDNPTTLHLCLPPRMCSISLESPD